MTGAALRYALRAAWARRRRTLPYVLLLVVAVGVVGATTGIAGRAGSAARTTAERDQAGRVVDVEPDTLVPGGATLTRATLARLAAIAGVQRVLPATRVPVGVKTDTIPGVLLAGTTLQTSRPDMTAPPGAPLPVLRRGEVLLPDEAQGSKLAGLVGRRVSFESQRATGVGTGTGLQYPLRVVGTYDPRYQVDGRDVAYLALEDVEELAAAGAGVSVLRYETQLGFESAQLVTADESQVPGVVSRAQAVGLSATTLAQQYAELPAVLDLTRLLGRVLGVLLVFVVLFAAAAQTALTVRSRWSEIGVLRAVGAGRLDVVLAFVVEAAIPTAIGVAVGSLASVPLGLFLVRLIGDSATQAGLERSSLPEPGPVALFAALTLLGGVLGAVFSARRAASLDPSTALRPS
jgi:putative ABC transport system permease protein